MRRLNRTEIITSQVCTGCNIEKDISEYYTYHKVLKTTGIDTEYYNRKCKSCYGIDTELRRNGSRFYRKVVRFEYRNITITLSDGEILFIKNLNQQGLRKLIKEGYTFILKDNFSKHIKN